MPSREILTAMGKFNEELVKAGVMLAGEGLHPSSKGKRVKFSGGKHTMTDGPFTETKELIAGFWLWQVRSMDEAVEWLKRSPVRRRDRDRNSPGIRAGRLRRRTDSRTQRAGESPAETGRREKVRVSHPRRSVFWNDRVGILTLSYLTPLKTEFDAALSLHKTE